MRVSSRKSSKDSPPASRVSLSWLSDMPLRAAMPVMALVRVSSSTSMPRSLARCSCSRFRINRSRTCFSSAARDGMAVPRALSSGNTKAISVLSSLCTMTSLLTTATIESSGWISALVAGLVSSRIARIGSAICRRIDSSGNPLVHLIAIDLFFQEFPDGIADGAETRQL